MTIRLNPRGFDDVATSGEVRSEINRLAERVADQVRAQNIWVDGIPGDIALPVKVVEQTTDRARAQVQLAHPSGLAVEAKHGVLGKAALEAGLELNDS